MQQKFSYFLFNFQFLFDKFVLSFIKQLIYILSSRSQFLVNRNQEPVGPGTWRTGTRIQSELVPGDQEPGSNRNWYLENRNQDPVGTGTWRSGTSRRWYLENRNQDPVVAGTWRPGTQIRRSLLSTKACCTFLLRYVECYYMFGCRYMVVYLYKYIHVMY